MERGSKLIFMTNLAPVLISVVVAFWVVAIAIVSIQNATPVTLKFLIFQSIQIPIGLILAFSVGLGLITMAVLLPLWKLADSGYNSQSDEDTEFFVDEEDF